MAGQLSVTIVEARALDDEDAFRGSTDAYVEVYIDHDYKQRTETISNSTNPQWNERFQFLVEPRQNHIHIKVYDDDGKAGRDAVGSAKIDLEPVKASGYFDDWVKLPKLFGLGSHGQIHVRMNFQA
ncbi:unnamed protein product [Rotaria sp. Silwood2]|nr:unnamed protein product [Rotaria sp. Silwood2]CAF2606625.1 unnamed protein product [Rotaria sp. Silwood2]CAF2848359.1 unnamed protein product [Rotaria sp. Silwood2]CAF4102762.1 unnamed protein product [Rotaria sp. Silwood2]CAF4210557.1 unnamed protein product [Rotaria sp. Silwood2]